MSFDREKPQDVRAFICPNANQRQTWPQLITLLSVLQKWRGQALLILFVCIQLVSFTSAVNAHKRLQRNYLTSQKKAPRDFYPIFTQNETMASRHRDFTRRENNEIFIWGSWAEFSSCSQSCGTGIRNRKRKCHKTTEAKFKQVHRRHCSGSNKDYEICNKQQCEVETNSFKIRACASYNRRKYRGRYYKWRPIDSVTHPCHLVCENDNYPFYMKRKFPHKLPDGSECDVTSVPGVCVNKQCIPIGCDTRLHSTKTYDACGVCGGQNHTCDVTNGITMATIGYGYTEVLTIPPRASNIRVMDVSDSLAVFALRNDHGLYFVNGKLSSQSRPTVYEDVAGTTFRYYHPLYAGAGDEKVAADGPTNETLYVMMLSSSEQAEVNVSYQYVTPIDNNHLHTVPGTRPRPVYVHQKHRPGTGVLRGHVDTSRDTSTKPETMRPGGDGSLLLDTGQKDLLYSNNSNQIGTNTFPEDKYRERVHHISRDLDDLYEWVTNPAAHCSATCNPGIQTSVVRCVRRADGLDVDDEYCDVRRKPSPANSQCQGKPCDARWRLGAWSSCSVSCGEGVQSRSVRCWRLLQPGFDSSVTSELCQGAPKPVDVRRCTEAACREMEQVMWLQSEWSECSNKCGHGLQTRVALCSSATEQCDVTAKPISIRQCSSGACYNKWVVSKWSVCSGKCGSGLQYRRVSCLDPQGSFQEDEHCDQNRKPLSVQGCGEGPTCPPVWVVQTWGKCSASCGDGLIARDVVCGEVVNGDFTVTQEQRCAHQYKPATRSRCRRDPCPPQWYTSEWSECSKTCGSDGRRTRTTICYMYMDKTPSSNCDVTTKPTNRESCNQISCSPVIPSVNLSRQRNVWNGTRGVRERVTTPSPTPKPKVDIQRPEQRPPRPSVETSPPGPNVDLESRCEDKPGINCRDVVLRQGCTVQRYRKLCCHSCKTLRLSANNTTYRNRVARSVNWQHHHWMEVVSSRNKDSLVSETRTAG